jgi:GT2 family glycosyltransferase
MLGFDILAKKLRSSSLSANIDFKHNGNYTGQVESLYGACLLVRRKAFKEVGGFDETFYLYCEETDLIFRMARKGWKAYRVGEASVTHHEGEYRKEFPILATVLYQESRWIYAKKNFSLVGKLITFLFSVLGLVIRYIFSLESSRRKRYGVALGFWFGRTPSADPRKQIRQNNKENL